MIEVFFHNIWEHAESGNASYILLDCNHQEGSERMNWIQGIQRAIDYVEANITEEIDFEEVAKQAYSSSFHFQRVFGILCGLVIISVCAAFLWQVKNCQREMQRSLT